MTSAQVEQFVNAKVIPIVVPLLENEFLFLLDLTDSLKRAAMGESLSDSQKHLIRTDRPFVDDDKRHELQESSDSEAVTLKEVQSIINTSDDEVRDDINQQRAQDKKKKKRTKRVN